MPLPHGLRAFRHRDYRLYYAGQGTSQIGTWLQLIATSWLVYQLSGSAFMLGLASFALHIPFLVLSPIAGVWVDRHRKRRVLMVVQSIALLQALAMLALVASGQVQAWHLVAGNLVYGLVNAFDAPARQSMLVELVGGKEDLPNAIALASALMNGARFVGPMIGGAVIAAFGESWGFGLNALSYCASLGALAMMRGSPLPGEQGRSGLLHQLAEGFRYVFGFLPARSALLLLSATSFSVTPYQSLAPYFARDVFLGDSATLGLIVGTGGLGAATGVLYLATRSSVRGLLTLIPVAAAISGAALIGFALSKSLWLALPCGFLTAMGMLLCAASVNTVMQTIVEDRMRARVVSIYIMAFLGVMPLGALGSGALAEAIGPPATIALGGALALAAAALYRRRLPAIRREIRPVYEKLGIAR